MGCNSLAVGMNTTHFYNLLKNRQNELFEHENTERAQLAAQAPTSAGDVGDVGDASVLDTNTDYLLQLSDDDRREVLEIRGALERMQRGTFGKCECCTDEIDLARLERLPHARFCIECQSDRELRNRVSQLHATPKL